MQQPPRSARPQGNGAAHGSGAAPASVPVPPLTPRKKGEGLNNLIRSLESRYQLGFKVNDEFRSPARNVTAADAVAKKIQFLYYSHEGALHDALAAFASAAPYVAEGQKLHMLSDLLKSKTQYGSPVSRSGTPTRNVPPKTLKTPQLCKCIFMSFSFARQSGRFVMHWMKVPDATLPYYHLSPSKFTLIMHDQLYSYLILITYCIVRSLHNSICPLSYLTNLSMCVHISPCQLMSIVPHTKWL